MLRKLVPIIVASSVFGGVVGALATAATQSQATPSAIAAAVTRVNDANANRTLSAIKADLATLNRNLASPVGVGTFRSIAQDLYSICENTASGGLSFPTCAGND